jgi:hypothetical protein
LTGAEKGLPVHLYHIEPTPALLNWEDNSQIWKLQRTRYPNRINVAPLPKHAHIP